MAVMSDGCQPIEAAAEGGDARPGHAAPGGHDGPTGTNLGAPAFAQAWPLHSFAMIVSQPYLRS